MAAAALLGSGARAAGTAVVRDDDDPAFGSRRRGSAIDVLSQVDRENKVRQHLRGNTAAAATNGGGRAAASTSSFGATANSHLASLLGGGSVASASGRHDGGAAAAAGGGDDDGLPEPTAEEGAALAAKLLSGEAGGTHYSDDSEDEARKRKSGWGRLRSQKGRMSIRAAAAFNTAAEELADESEDLGPSRGWVLSFDYESQLPFFFNVRTHASSWTFPKVDTASGNVVFYNTVTRQSTLDAPEAVELVELHRPEIEPPERRVLDAAQQGGLSGDGRNDTAGAAGSVGSDNGTRRSSAAQRRSVSPLIRSRGSFTSPAANPRASRPSGFVGAGTSDAGGGGDKARQQQQQRRSTHTAKQAADALSFLAEKYGEWPPVSGKAADRVSKDVDTHSGRKPRRSSISTYFDASAQEALTKGSAASSTGSGSGSGVKRGTRGAVRGSARAQQGAASVPSSAASTAPGASRPKPPPMPPPPDDDAL